VFGVISAAGERPHAPERGHCQHRQQRLGAAGDDYIRLTALEVMIALDDGIMTAGARRRARHYRPFSADFNRDDARNRVCHRARNDERPHRAPALAHHIERTRLDLGDAAAARRHQHADALVIAGVDREAGVIQRLSRHSHRKLRRTMNAACGFTIHVPGGVEVLDLAGDVVRHVLGVETGDVSGAGFPRDQILPEGCNVIADWRKCAHASDEYSRHLDNPLSWFLGAPADCLAAKKGAATAPFPFIRNSPSLQNCSIQPVSCLVSIRLCIRCAVGIILSEYPSELY
jgi:hypothetical protein